jgi:hypothetical protein
LLSQYRSFDVNRIPLEIDSMHEAIQEITKLLALHLPRNDIVPTPLKSTEAFTELAPTMDEVVGSTQLSSTTEQTALVEETATNPTKPNRPNPEKRTSMLGAIGKVLWPFGSPNIPPVSAGDVKVLSAPNLIKAPTVTTSEILIGNEPSNEIAV